MGEKSASPGNEYVLGILILAIKVHYQQAV